MTDLPDPLILPLPGSTETMTLRRIPAGEFRMGARGQYPAEEPIHRVVIPQDFYLGEFPVTQAQFAVWTETAEYRDWFERHREIIRETSTGGVAQPHANHFPDRPRHPAENVTWWEARGFAEWLNASGVLPGGWRADLPGEAQWEYACRSGTQTAYWSGDREEDLARVGWYGGNAGGETHEVGEKGEGSAHRWGLSDLHGNVSEWCLDYFDARHHRRAAAGAAADAVLEKARVEPGEANPNHVDCAEMMARFAGGDDAVRDEDRAPLGWLVGVANTVLKNGDTSWQPVYDASSAARDSGRWSAAAQSIAGELRDIFRQWVKNATSVDSPARVLRGGAWFIAAAFCRSAFRYSYAPGDRDRYFGFRLAVVPGSGGTQSGGTQSGGTGAERRDGGEARRDAAAQPQSGRGAAGNPPRSGGDDFSETMTTTQESDRAHSSRALSSADGRAWWGVEVPFPFPAEPDPTVRKLVLGKLDEGGALTLDETTLDGLAEIGKHFPRLTQLHLWGLTNLVRVDGLPDGLECLDVRKCPGLTTVGSVSNSLRTLDLGSCPALSDLPVGPMHGLEYVWLDGCGGLGLFAPLKPALPTLKRLELNGCHFRDLDGALCGEPEENVAGQVLAYFNALAAQGIEPLAECKIVVLGNGGVGKTELVRSLKGLTYHPKQDSTDGIRLWHWHGGTEDGVVAPFAPFPEDGIDRVDLNVWDFGGQDLYHNTHRLFLENRAVFVVVWREPKRDAEGKIIPFREEHPEDPVRPLDYWLDQVYAFNPRARVVVVRTGADEGEPSGDWREEVREEYRGLDHFSVSSADRSQGDLPGLRTWILDRVRSELGGAEAVKMPRGRVAVRRALARWQPAWDEGDSVSPDSARPLLRRNEYVDLVREQFAQLGLGEPPPFEIGYQLDYFHHSGALYAPKKWLEEAPSRAAAPIIVDQRWAIEGIYRLVIPGEARDSLMRRHGRAKADQLDKVWSRLSNGSGEALYDHEAQWVIRRFMAACGLLVDQGEFYVLPEFLPDRSELEEFATNDPLVESALSASERRVYRICDRALGQGFGCLLVGRLVERFGKVPLFRYGGFAEVAVGNEYSGGERRVLVRLEWHRDNDDRYQGDIVATLVGPPVADVEVLAYLLELAQSFPGFPKDATFTSDDEHAVPSVMASVSLGSASLPARVGPSVRPLMRFGTVGISLAGEDSAHPGIEFWPEAIRRNLKVKLGENHEVIFYKRDKERQTLPQLVTDLFQSDLLVAVIGKKYLQSAYCLVEFFEAARHHQPESTFEDPGNWPYRVWPLVLPDTGELLVKAEKVAENEDHPCQKWCKDWVKASAEYKRKIVDEYEDEDSAEREAPRKYVYDSWMRFACRSKETLRAILGSLRNHRSDWVPAALPDPTTMSEREILDWADQTVLPIVEEIVERMERIVENVGDDDRLRRAAASCLRKWRQQRAYDAMEWFETFLAAWPDPARIRDEASNGPLPEEWKDLEPVRAFWCRRQNL